ncbi:hypothetical protein [Aeribacillus sp. FSL k6-2211]|uniref:hypothetical protein n=1 Tax=Aeribacillus sp. FSL k6-2211 TaxID=2954608 RepID=UPI0030D31E83
MSKKKRLHPISVVANIVKQLKDAILPIILVIIVGNKTISSMWDIAVPFAIIIYTIVIGIVSWIRFTYRLEEGELRIEYGVFVRKNGTFLLNAFKAFPYHKAFCKECLEL